MIPATLEQFLEENPQDWLVSEEVGKISDVIPGFKPNPEYFPEVKPEPFQQAPAVIIDHTGEAMTLIPLPAPNQPKLKRYCFDATGKVYQGETYTPEQWEALKTKLGAVIEVEALNQVEAWKLYEARPKVQIAQSNSQYDTICSKCGKRWPMFAPANCDCGAEILPF